MGGYFTPTTNTVISVSDYATYVRDQVVTQFATSAARASAITAPSEGMVTAIADADEVDLYNGSAWVPIGPQCTDALNITAAAPFVSGTSFSSEAEISSKMRLTIPQVRTTEVWLLVGQMLCLSSSNNSDWTLRARETNTSGTQIGAGYVPNIGAAISQVAWSMVWVPGANATSQVIVWTLTRNAGTSTLSIYNQASSVPSLFVAALRLGRSGAYRSVA